MKLIMKYFAIFLLFELTVASPSYASLDQRPLLNFEVLDEGGHILVSLAVASEQDFFREVQLATHRICLFRRVVVASSHMLVVVS